MIMNGTNILSTYGATLTGREIYPCEMVNFDDWLATSSRPIQTQPDSQEWSKIKASLLVEGSSEEDVLLKISSIVSLCRRGELKFPDFNFSYHAILNEHSSKMVMETAYELGLDFAADYKIGAEKSVYLNRVTSGTVNNPGNVPTPCIIEVTPSISLSDFTVGGAARNITSGADEPITIKSLSAGQKVTINGEDCTITAGGANKFADSSFWEFPSLLPGSNSLFFSRNTCDVTIRFRPRYL